MFEHLFSTNEEDGGDFIGGMDFRLRRPFLDNRGRKCLLLPTGKTVTNKEGKPMKELRTRYIHELQAHGYNLPVWNYTSLPKQSWVQFDNVVMEVFRARLTAWTDLAAASTYGGFDGMAATELESETISDPGEAHVDMDGLTEGYSDAERYNLTGLPLPITHCDFWFSERMMAIARRAGRSLSTLRVGIATRRVAEMVEKTTIGSVTGIALDKAGGLLTSNPQVYGYTNFPGRATNTALTAPTGSNAATTIAEVLEMRQSMYDMNHYGPFMLYHSNNWDEFMDNDYILTGGNVATQTLRERLRAIGNISDVKRLDFLGTPGSNHFTLLLVEMTQETVQAVVGMPVRTVQWDSVGGMRHNFKVMCIHVPRVRSDFNGSCGIVHATTA